MYITRQIMFSDQNCNENIFEMHLYASCVFDFERQARCSMNRILQNISLFPCSGSDEWKEAVQMTHD